MPVPTHRSHNFLPFFVQKGGGLTQTVYSSNISLRGVGFILQLLSEYSYVCQ